MIVGGIQEGLGIVARMFLGPGALEALMIREGRQLAVGDTVAVPHPDLARHARSAVDRAPSAGSRRFICRRCYFIYEEGRGLPQQSIVPGTAFATLPATWRCPDCGTQKTTFRPYVSPGGTIGKSVPRDT